MTLHDRLFSIFMPHAFAQFARVRGDTNIDFCHYTSIDNIKKIIQGGLPSLWLRNATVMNDSSEIVHGYQTINWALDKDGRRQRLHAALSAVSPEIANEALSLFQGHLQNTLRNTYIACLSEFDARQGHGKLSMWRAYGGEAIGAMIVLNKQPLISPSDALGISISPVAYHQPAVLVAEMDSIIDEISRNADWLKLQSPEILKSYIFSMLRFGMACLKHWGFEEEKEWRMLYNPDFYSDKQLPYTFETVGGVFQQVYKIPLRDVEGPSGIVGITPDALIKKIVIGPTNHPEIVMKAAIAMLRDAGFRDPHTRVEYSNIPLRTFT